VSLLKSASTVSLWTLASRITGLVRELLIASVFGASALTDAFNVAFRIPNLFRRLFAEGAFSQAFVPVLASTLTEKGQKETEKLITEVALIMSVTLLGVSILGVLASPVLVWLMVMLYAHHGVFVVTFLKQLGYVMAEDHIRIHEQRPALEVG
jgi:putative peptidoglycan lipid II flippase